MRSITVFSHRAKLRERYCLIFIVNILMGCNYGILMIKFLKCHQTDSLQITDTEVLKINLYSPLRFFGFKLCLSEQLITVVIR